MHALLIVDRLFARHEKRLIERTVVGLLDEGIGVRLVVPDQGPNRSPAWEAPVPTTPYTDRGFSFMVPMRARSIARAITKDAPEIDWNIVHAFGGQTWPLAHEIARQFEAALVLEVWRAGLAPQAQALSRSSTVPLICLAPDPTIARAIEDQGVSLPMRVVPWGVPSPISPREVLKQGERASIVFHSGARDRSACIGAFDGLIDAVRARTQVHVFVNVEASQRAALWERAQEGGILDRLSMVDQIESQRDLVLDADVYVNPDTVHEQRTMLLEALASGLVVICAGEDQSSVLIDAKTAMIVRTKRPSDWEDAIGVALDDRNTAHELGHGAWAYIREHRKRSTHIGATIDAYAQVSGAGAQA